MAKSTNKQKNQSPGPSDAFSQLVASANRRDSGDEFSGSKLVRRSLSEQVADRIMAMIKSGNLKSGDRLPTEQKMTIAFGISRPSLREALKALSLMGVLESRQGGRYTVTDLSPGRLVAPLNAMFAVADYDANEHFDCRVVIELDLIRRCSEQASPEHKQRIMKLAVDGRAFYDDPVAFRLLDMEFHEALYAGANNRMLSVMAHLAYDMVLDERRIATEMPGVIKTSVTQHCEVADAMVAGHTDQAVAAYHHHLEHIRDSTIDVLQNNAQTNQGL